MLALFQNEIGYSHGQIATSCVPSPFSNVNQTTLQHCLPHYEENIAPVIGASFVSISVFSFRFPFPVSISSFRFVSISCFSICPVFIGNYIRRVNVIKGSLYSRVYGTFFCGKSKSARLANAFVDSQKLDAILHEPCSYYAALLLYQNGLRRNFRASNI